MSSSDVIAADLPQHLALCTEVEEHLDKALKSASDLGAKSAEAKPDLSDGGLSFLRLKNRLMADYLANLGYVMLRKSRGKSISDESETRVIERLVTLRTYLEKMRPIEQKLKYQIDKAIKLAESGELKADDPLNFKPNINALDVDDDDAEGSSSDDDDEGQTKAVEDMANRKYVAPKHIPAFYDDDRQNNAEEAEAAKKKTLLSKSLIDDLKRQHLDTPEEIHHNDDVLKKRHIDAMKERIRYEEDNFTRLPLAKKVKQQRRSMSTMGTIGDEMTSFGKSFFTKSAPSSGGKKRKSGGGSSKKKRFRK